MRWCQKMVWMTESRSQLFTTVILADLRRVRREEGWPYRASRVSCSTVYAGHQMAERCRASMRLGGAWKGMDILSVFGLHGGTLTSA